MEPLPKVRPSAIELLSFIAGKSNPTDTGRMLTLNRWLEYSARNGQDPVDMLRLVTISPWQHVSIAWQVLLPIWRDWIPYKGALDEQHWWMYFDEVLKERLMKELLAAASAADDFGDEDTGRLITSLLDFVRVQRDLTAELIDDISKKVAQARQLDELPEFIASDDRELTPQESYLYVMAGVRDDLGNCKYVAGIADGWGAHENALALIEQRAAGLEVNHCGGGKFQYRPLNGNAIQLFGASRQYGKDRERKKTIEILKRRFPGFQIIQS